MYTFDALENFWKRFSKVSLDKLALEKERSLLQAENMQLKMLLKQYLDGISVNDEIMSQTNPLMILSSRRVLEYVIHVSLNSTSSNPHTFFFFFLGVKMLVDHYRRHVQWKLLLKLNMWKVLFDRLFSFFIGILFFCSHRLSFTVFRETQFFILSFTNFHESTWENIHIKRLTFRSMHSLQ